MNNKQDDLEKRIYERISLLSGFAYQEVLQRNLEKEMKAFDIGRVGMLGE